VAYKFVLYLVSILLFIAAISYSDSGVSASIRVSATVVQPIGLSSFSILEYKNNELENESSSLNPNSEIQLLLRIPHNQSAICIIETSDGKQLYYSVSEDILPVASINGQSNILSEINQITLIYSEN